MSRKHDPKYILCLVSSLILNFYLAIQPAVHLGGERRLSWSRLAAEQAEIAAALSCSGHGRAYLDGLALDDWKPVCECHTCYGGPDCSQLLPGCVANADAGDPLFLEPFWTQHAASSAILVAGWHRMSYSYDDQTLISSELERHIRKVHEIVGNAVTDGRYIVFGAGTTQLLNAAVHALSPENASSPARVVASIPYYGLYRMQTEFFLSKDFDFQGDAAALLRNASSANIIEFVTSPNNPDGQLNKAILHGPNVKTIYDRVYYWPHFTAIEAPAEEDVMLFSLSKLTGHAGSRFGWAVIKDEAVYQRISNYIRLNTLGVSRDTQLRALKLLKVVLEGNGREIFEFGHKTMKDRWEKFHKIISLSKRFSLQKFTPLNCTFLGTVRKPSPAYAWLRCEREEDEDCYAVLKAANISGREGSVFGDEDRYVRLSIIRGQDDFDLLLQKLYMLVSEESGAKTM